MEQRSYSGQLYNLYKTRSEFNHLIPQSLQDFVKGSMVKLLFQEPTELSPEREAYRKDLAKNRDLRRLTSEHDLGHSIQWVDEDGITLRQTLRNPNDSLNVELCIEQILHEIGHFLECRDDKAILQDWGLKWPVDYQKDASLSPKGFMAEFRACAYDLALRRMLKIPVSHRNAATLDSTVYSVMSVSNKQDIFKLPEIKHLAPLDAANYVTVHIIRDFTNELALSFTDEIVMKEWNRKNDLVREHLSQTLQVA